ncbi:unnamed protein product, partial [Closterium sp. NIES-53]
VTISPFQYTHSLYYFVALDIPGPSLPPHHPLSPLPFTLFHFPLLPLNPSLPPSFPLSLPPPNHVRQILELLDHKAIFTAGYKAVLHVHSVVEECEIISLLQQTDLKTKKPMKKKPLFVKSGAIVVVRIQVSDPICVEKFSDFPQLGRFTLRDEGKTVAIGKVTHLRSSSSA